MKTNVRKKPRRSIKQAPVDLNQCALCLGSEQDEEKYGKFFKNEEENLAAHQFCLFFASGLAQNGEDDEGFDGFVFEDIRVEIRRASRLSCTLCYKKGASIGCSIQKCRSSFHFSCGLERLALFQFFGSFCAFCRHHRPSQKEYIHGTCQSCPICLCDINFIDGIDSLSSPCCKNALFHRTCVQKQALASGCHFFRCAFCNNLDTFQKEMNRMGIYIPERDAAWEQGDAYADLLHSYNKCDNETCLCPNGREFSGQLEGKDWQILLCYTCGQSGTHLQCKGWTRALPRWLCTDCETILLKSDIQCAAPLEECQSAQQIISNDISQSPSNEDRNNSTSNTAIQTVASCNESSHDLIDISSETSSEVDSVKSCSILTENFSSIPSFPNFSESTIENTSDFPNACIIDPDSMPCRPETAQSLDGSSSSESINIVDVESPFDSDEVKSLFVSDKETNNKRSPCNSQISISSNDENLVTSSIQGKRTIQKKTYLNTKARRKAFREFLRGRYSKFKNSNPALQSGKNTSFEEFLYQERHGKYVSVGCNENVSTSLDRDQNSKDRFTGTPSKSPTKVRKLSEESPVINDHKSIVKDIQCRNDYFHVEDYNTQCSETSVKEKEATDICKSSFDEEFSNDLGSKNISISKRESGAPGYCNETTTIIVHESRKKEKKLSSKIRKQKGTVSDGDRVSTNHKRKKRKKATINTDNEIGLVNREETSFQGDKIQMSLTRTENPKGMVKKYDDNKFGQDLYLKRKQNYLRSIESSFGSDDEIEYNNVHKVATKKVTIEPNCENDGLFSSELDSHNSSFSLFLNVSTESITDPFNDPNSHGFSTSVKKIEPESHGGYTNASEYTCSKEKTILCKNPSKSPKKSGHSEHASHSSMNGLVEKHDLYSMLTSQKSKKRKSSCLGTDDVVNKQSPKKSSKRLKRRKIDSSGHRSIETYMTVNVAKSSDQKPKDLPSDSLSSTPMVFPTSQTSLETYLQAASKIVSHAFKRLSGFQENDSEDDFELKSCGIHPETSMLIDSDTDSSLELVKVVKKKDDTSNLIDQSPPHTSSKANLSIIDDDDSDDHDSGQGNSRDNSDAGASYTSCSDGKCCDEDMIVIEDSISKDHNVSDEGVFMTSEEYNHLQSLNRERSSQKGSSQVVNKGTKTRDKCIGTRKKKQRKWAEKHTQQKSHEEDRGKIL